MAYFKIHEKNYWESSKLTNSNQGRTMHTLYPVNYLIKTTPESTFGLHLDSFKSQHQLLRNLKFYQLYFIWAPLYISFENLFLGSCSNARCISSTSNVVGWLISNNWSQCAQGNKKFEMSVVSPTLFSSDLHGKSKSKTKLNLYYWSMFTLEPLGLLISSSMDRSLLRCIPEERTVICFKAGKGSQPTKSAAGNFFKRGVEKTYPFCMKTYPIWKEGWEVPDGLEKKNYPVLFLKSLGPLGPTLVFFLESCLTHSLPSW